ncbi:MAG: AMP-binding protein [Bacteroidia bacterium]
MKAFRHGRMQGRFWDIVHKYRVNILYTAPTAIRSLMTFGLGPVRTKDLSSLKYLEQLVNRSMKKRGTGTIKYRQKRCPIVDTWWQTETGGIMISNMAGITPAKPSFATLPLPGIQPILVDENWNRNRRKRVSGNLCIKYPWPSIIRTTYGDHERCRLNYFSTYPNLYFTGEMRLSAH